MVTEILINIGNTHAQFAVFDGKNVSITEVVKTAEIPGDPQAVTTLAENPQSRVCISSVVPKVSARLKVDWRQRTLVFLSWKMIKGVDWSSVDVSTVGADRLANVSAAVARLRLPVIIVDCGTAITTEVVDADKRFLGGAIIPGRKLWRKALHLHTGQLPERPLLSVEPPAVGGTTADAMDVMDCAVVGAVERVISKTREVVKGAEVWFTGGDAGFFADTVGGKCLPENFTLTGLAEVAKQFR
jgi:type III pantothenate kinase